MKNNKIMGNKNPLVELIKNKLTGSQIENLHLELEISKKMLTMLLRSPKRFTTAQGKKIADMAGISIEDFLKIINS